MFDGVADGMEGRIVLGIILNKLPIVPISFGINASIGFVVNTVVIASTSGIVNDSDAIDCRMMVATMLGDRCAALLRIDWDRYWDCVASN